MGEPAARTLYREKGWRPSVVDPYAARCGTSTLTATSVRTGFHYLDLMRALPDVFVAKFGPTFVALHPTVPLQLVYNNHFCFTVLDAVQDPRDKLLDMEDRLKHLTPHFYQASIRSFTYRLESELITLISRSSVKYNLHYDPSRPMRIQYLRYWTHDEQTAMHDYAIPRGKMDLLRRTRSDRVHPRSSFVEVDLNIFTGWQWLMNDEMELQVCRPQLHGRENPALIKWRLSNGLTYAEAFRRKQVRDEQIQRTANMRGMDSNVLRFVETRGRRGEGTPLGVLKEGFREVILEMEDRLYVVYPRYIVMRDVQFIHMTGEKITVAAVGQPGDTLEQKIEKAREKTGQTHGEPISEHQEFVRALGKSMFLQKARQTSACALRVMGKGLLDEVYIDAPRW